MNLKEEIVKLRRSKNEDLDNRQFNIALEYCLELIDKHKEALIEEFVGTSRIKYDNETIVRGIEKHFGSDLK